jgi:phosphoserine phosphatase
MTHVATLISSPAARALDETAIARVRAVLTNASEPDWLSRPGLAADIYFSPGAGEDDKAVTERALARLAARPIDVVVQACHHRRKKLLVADMDSTMIGQECIDELAGAVGVRSRVEAITERAMQGEIAFEAALSERLALLDGLPMSLIDLILRDLIRPNPGGMTLIATMRAQGAYTCLVSGGFTLFTAPLAAHLGFDEHRANRLIVNEERIVGQVQQPILGPAAKVAALTELRHRLRLAETETLAVGDGANDIPMLRAAGLGVGYRPKPKVRAAAKAWIEHGDLTALLYLQGYRESEFVVR